MIEELRIYLRLRPLIKQIGELAKMRLSVNVILQMLALIAQDVNLTEPILTTPKAKTYAAVALAFVQGLVGILAHFSNPDGTPAEAPYVPKK